MKSRFTQADGTEVLLAATGYDTFDPWNSQVDLVGRLDGTAPERNRMACWLARSALEEAVRNRLLERGRPTGTASMRTMLTCLEVAYADDPALVDGAEHAWAGLSNACHRHAFQLSPTAQETQRLIDTVRVTAGSS